MPIGAHLVLNEHADPEDILLDGDRLGAVVAAAADRYQTPLAFPLMDLTLEKSDLLAFIGVSPDKADVYHFDDVPPLDLLGALKHSADRGFPDRQRASLGAISYVAERTSLCPVGMCIGPFSLMTKLVADPIVHVATAGMGVRPEDDDGVLLVERCLELALTTVMRGAMAQIQAGARSLIVCEPAANIVYLSPRQLRTGSDIFDRYVVRPNAQLRDLLAMHDVDLIFHNCGELLDDMVRRFATELHPVILSLGSSRKLWHDATLTPLDVVLFGNLPTKTFYSDAVMPVEEVYRLTEELLSRMRACGHPHILGSECDVLHVADSAETIRRKVQAMLSSSTVVR